MENKAYKNRRLALKITIRAVILFISCLSLFLWFYDASLDYEVKIVPTGQQGETDFLIKKKYVLYGQNPGSLEVELDYNISRILYRKEEKQLRDTRHQFASQHLKAKVLTVTVEYSDGQSEHIDIYLNQLLNVRYKKQKYVHDFEIPVPIGILKYTYQFNPTLIKEMSPYFDLEIKHIPLAPQNSFIAMYLDILTRAWILIPVLFLLAGWSLLSIILTLKNVNKSTPQRWRDVMLQWFFSSPMGILIFLMITYLLLVIVVNVLALSWITVDVSGDVTGYFLFTLFLPLLIYLFPLVSTVGTYMLAPWLYKKFGLWSPEQCTVTGWPPKKDKHKKNGILPSVQCRSMFIFSIGVSGVWGGIISMGTFDFLGFAGFDGITYQPVKFYLMATAGGQSFWLTVLFQGVSFFVQPSRSKNFLNGISFWCCIISFMGLWLWPFFAPFFLIILRLLTQLLNIPY